MSTSASAVLRRSGSALALMLLLGSCAALPPMPPRSESHALDPSAATPLAARVAAEKALPGQSGVRLLDGGEDAFATLMFLADAAVRTLDLQYYALLNDASSRVLLQRVRAAADRGVRVRLLLDDLNTSGTDDALRRLTDHPRIEVRLYNPLPGGRLSTITKVMASLHDAKRINSRMHNKAFIADNTLGVTGGRNIGDPYFIRTEEANFFDLDLLVAGPAVRQLSAMFDRFWNSELAYPADAVIPRRAQAPAASASAPLDAPDALPEPARAGVQQRLAQLQRGFGLQWAPARLIADLPSKSLKEGAPNDAETMFDDLGALLGSAQREVLIVTPYFVPGAKGMAMIHELRKRGVKLRVLTAAMAATDAPVVHVGYSKYRPALLAAGVELYELRPEFTPPSEPHRSGVHSRTNLHSKAVIVDRRTVLVGSMNVDPRSDKHNTEMGLLVRSAPLAEQLIKIVEHACHSGAYQIDTGDDGRLRWRYTERDGRVVALTSEPRVSVFKRFGFKLLAPLAPEEML